MRRPNLFMVGAPKCGTSSMYTYLRQHPRIFMSNPKEPHYFGKDHRRVNHEPRTEEQYLELFAGATDQPWVGDASTSYLHSESAAREIKAFSPDARVVIMLRNPVDVMSALHSTTLTAGFEFIEHFEEALQAEDDRKNGVRLPRSRPGLLENLLYRDTVCYTAQVHRYLDVFGWDRVHIIIFDDFANDTAAAYTSTLRFLELEADVQPTFATVNANRSPRSASFNNFLWNPPASVQALARSVVPRRARNMVVEMMKQANLRSTPRTRMDPDLRNRLTGELSQEINDLGRLLKRDLSQWCQAASAR